MLADVSRPIVLLEDDEMISCVVEAALGLKVLRYSNGQSLFDNAHNLRPAALLVDIHIGPEISGLELIPRLREIWKFVPIIVITSDAADERIGEALAAGADDFIRKPIKPKELLARFQARSSEQTRLRDNKVKILSDVEFDSLHFTLTGTSCARSLSMTEAKLFDQLLEARGTLVPRSTLKLNCWGGLKVTDKALDRKVHLLRSALSDVSTKLQIKAVYGQGFKLEVIS